jgi:hypothetical protein
MISLIKVPALMALLVSVTMISAGAKSDDSSLFVEKTTVDFGTLTVAQVSKNKLLETVFKIKNTSDQVLKITKIATSCGCTSAKPDKTEALPGESINLAVLINLEGKSGKNKVQIVVSFGNGDLVPLEANYDVQIDASLFPL